jgi:tyrocidine synthetase-3
LDFKITEGIGIMESKNKDRDRLEIAAAKKIKERDFWLNQLKGNPVKTRFPFDYDKRKPGEGCGNELVYRFRFPGEIFSKLTKLSRGSDYTLNAILAAGLAALLNKYTGSRDIIFGAPIYKQEIETEFINTLLVLRNPVKENMTFKDLLLQVSQTIMEATGNYSYPLEILPGDFPFIDIAILLENIHDREYLRHINSSITFCFLRKEHSLEVTLQYNPLLYKKDTIARIAVHYAQLLRVFLSNLELRISVMDFLPGEEKNRVLFEFNNSGSEYPGHKTIHELFAEQAARTDDGIAVTSPEQGAVSLTYRELNKITDQLACMLEGKGVMPGIIVGIMVERSLEMVVGILGILKAGGAYLPINPGNPQERIDYMLADSKAKVLVVDDTSYASWLSFAPKALLNLSAGHHLNFPASQLPSFPASLPSSLAYIIYTSGSTGNPKAVPINHSNVCPLLHWGYRQLALGSGDRVIQNLSYYFDWSVWEIFITLTSGASLYMITREISFNPGAQVDFIHENAITALHVTPTQWQYLVNVGHKQETLKYLFIGAEKLTYDLVRRSYRLVNESCRVFNMYGPTEAAIISAVLEIHKPGLSRYKELSSVPLGKPIANAKLYILDRHMNPRPVNLSGELYIAGDCLAKGYLNHPQLTAEKFCLRRPGGRFLKKLPREASGLPRKNFSLKEAGNNRCLSHYPIYKTGDLARWLTDGNIEFLGRIDHQVKIRGFRIELGEIENRLLEHDKIKEAVVTANQRKGGDKYLCAYVVHDRTTTAGQPYSGAGDAKQCMEHKERVDLREYLSQTLPDYMIPSYFVPLERIPLNPNGKVDLKALPAPETKAKEAYRAPRDEIEKKLVEIWAKVLGIDSRNLGIEDDFLDLGGHSLKAALMASKIHKTFHVNVPLPEIFNYSTIRALAAYIKQAAEDRYFPIAPAEKKEYYPLSSTQDRLYVLRQMDEDGPGIGYNIPSLWRLDGDEIRSKLENTFLKLIMRHESLRTSFHIVNDEPVQKIHDEVEFEIEYDQSLVNGHWSSVNCQGRGEVPSPIKVEKIIRDFIGPFDLSQAPLFRVGLVKIEEEKYLLMVDMHHIISDGTSLNVIIKDFMALHGGGQPLALRIQYKDISAWRNCKPYREQIKSQEVYWQKQFKEEINVLNLPTDYARPLVQSFEGSVLKFEIDKEDTRVLKSLAHKEGTTLFIVLLAIYTIFLSRLCGQEDIVVGTPVAGRRHPDLELITGMFVNTLALRNAPNHWKSFTRYLKEVKERTWEALENQDYPYEDLVDRVNVERNTQRNPLFDTMFTLQDKDTRVMDMEIPGLKLKPYNFETTISKFDLSLHGLESKEKLILSIEYCTKLFKEETVKRFTNYFKTIVSFVTSNPERKIREIEIISEEEKKQVLVDFNETGAQYPQDKTIHELFEQQVESTPDHIALIGQISKAFGGMHLTYKELNEKSNHLGHLLREKGVKPDTMERSIEIVTGLLGILKAGGAYLPIDPEYPEDRIKYILKDSEAKILVTVPGLSGKFEKLSIVNCQLLIVNEIPPNRRRLNNPPKEANSINNYQLTINNLQLEPTFLAYIIYTSGSTGKPKGVLVEHRNVTAYIYAFYRECRIETTDTLVQLNSYAFDIFVEEVYPILLKGGKIVIPDVSILLDMDSLSRQMVKYDVSIVDTTPLLLNEFNRRPAAMESVRVFISGGDVLKKEYVNNLVKLGHVYNSYGPTETTVCAAFFHYSGAEEHQSNIPIGKPIAGYSIYIVDNRIRFQPPGIAGELCISGNGVTRGYLNRPELTAEKFDHDLWDLQDYHDGGYHRSHMSHKSYITHLSYYKTGDLARWLPDGNIEFLGRIDHQVKIRGYRIEPGEIVNRLLNHEKVKKAEVIVKERMKEDKYLCAYIVTGEKLEFSQLKSHLSKALPAYMIPSYFVSLDKMPLTPNGKIDRQALPEPELAGDQTGYAAPRDVREMKLTSQWGEILGIKKEKISIDDNFFQLGGHSLKAAILVSKIKIELNVKLSLAEFFKIPTIRGLSQHLENSGYRKHETMPAVEKKEYYELSSAQKRLYLLQQTDLKSTNYNMPGVFIFAGKLNREKFVGAFQALIHQHDALRIFFIQVKGKVLQKPGDYVEFKLKYKEISHEKEVRNHIKEFVNPFDLGKAPLFRVELAALAKEKHLLLFDMHHIISDGVSIEILFNDFGRLYEGKGLAPLPLQYKDYAAWQNKRLNEKKLKLQEKYWLKKLEGFVFTQLPFDRFEGINQVQGKKQRLEIDTLLYEKIEKFCGKHNVTKFVFMLTVFQVVLAREIDQTDITIGIPVSIREHYHFKNIIGIFLNVLLIRTIILDRDTFINHLSKSNETVIEALNNQQYPYEILNAKIRKECHLMKHELFSILFNYLPLEETKEISTFTNDFALRSLEAHEVFPKYDITLYVHDTHKSMALDLVYKSNVYDEYTIKSLLEDFSNVIHLVSGSEDMTIEELASLDGDIYDDFEVQFVEYCQSE